MARRRSASSILRAGRCSRISIKRLTGAVTSAIGGSGRMLGQLARNSCSARHVGDNPNGSLRSIAGITNERGNVVGLMPHPEHAVEDLCGPGTDGLGFFTGLAASVFA